MSTVVSPPPAQEAPLGAGQGEYSAPALPRFLFIVSVNILVLLELCVAMYRATNDMDAFTPVFFKTFFTLLVPTLVGAYLGKRLFFSAKDKT